METIRDEHTLQNVSQLRLPALSRRRTSARREALSISLAGLLGASACFVDSPAETGAATAAAATSSSSSTSTSSSSSVETSASAATTSPTSTSSASVGSTSASTSSPGSTTTGCAVQPWYLDGDNDGYGDPEAPLEACEAPEGYVDNGLDCDDTIDEINPGADELCDMIDNDCDQIVDEWSPANELCDGCSMHAIGDSVYHVCAGKYVYATARASCQDRGGDLVVIETLAEGSEIFDLVDNGNLSSWLIGLTDADSEGSFVWVDGTPLVPGQSNWSPNEPNDSMMNEDCVVLATIGSWNDIDCAIPRSMICEVPL